MWKFVFTHGDLYLNSFVVLGFSCRCFDEVEKFRLFNEETLIGVIFSELGSHFIISEFGFHWVLHPSEKSLRGVMFKEQDYGQEVSEFELQPVNYVYFQTNTPGKGINPLISIPTTIWH